MKELTFLQYDYSFLQECNFYEISVFLREVQYAINR